MNINYDSEKNEVIITGCVNCPFGFENPRAEADCGLIRNLFWFTGLPYYFPTDCPLRDPNFKLTRNMSNKDEETHFAIPGDTKVTILKNGQPTEMSVQDVKRGDYIRTYDFGTGDTYYKEIT